MVGRHFDRKALCDQVVLSSLTVSAFAGTMFERLQVICSHKQDLQDWVEHLSRQIKHTAATAPSHKPLTVPCHTVGNRWSFNTAFQTVFALF